MGTTVFDYHARDASIVQHCDLCVLEDHRIFYICHTSRTSHWEPPWASWRCRLGLPYGWEQARDQSGHHYYIDHIHRTTTYQDPRKSTAPSGKRTVKVKRKTDIGFGFVAAGQQPTIIQFVSPEGPSDGLLYANDQILNVNGEDVSELKKDEVVERVRAAADEVELTVEQVPHKHTKTVQRASRRNFKVRFTDRVLVASHGESSGDFPPSIPFVLRVFLENGQTRSFKYDEQTTVKDILSALMSKLHVTSQQYFSLAVEYSLGARTSRVSLLRNETGITEVLALPNAAHFRVVLRFAFLPREIPNILEEDRNAFEYLYQQCVNDVVRGRFAYEMRYEACVRLAALQMQQVSLESTVTKEGRVSVSKIEKEYGLDVFLPTILLDNVKKKEIRKHLRFYLKRDDVKMTEYQNNGKTENPCTPEEKALLVRLKYLHIVSHLPSFGGRGFSVTFKESQIDMIMQIDPRNGLLVRHPGKTGQPAISIGFDLIGRVVVRTETEVTSLVSIRLAANEAQGLEFIVERDDVDDLISFLCGYHQVQLSKNLPCDVTARPPSPPARPTTPPAYESVHTVVSTGWNYAAQETANPLKILNLTEEPPGYELANMFDDIEEEVLGKLSLKDLKINGDVKQILKAKDSLLIKNSRELQLKEMASPILRRPSNPSGCKMEVVSDSSDTEDSSFSSPMRSPGNSARSDDVDELASSAELLVPEMNGRRASIETLIQTAPTQFASNLETLILMFPDNPMETSVTTPQEDKPNGCHNVNKRMSLKGYLEDPEGLRLIDD